MDIKVGDHARICADVLAIELSKLHLIFVGPNAGCGASGRLKAKADVAIPPIGAALQPDRDCTLRAGFGPRLRLGGEARSEGAGVDGGEDGGNCGLTLCREGRVVGGNVDAGRGGIGG